MSSDDFATRALVGLFASMFLGGAITSFIDNGFGANPRQYIFGVIGLILLLIAWQWPRLEPQVPTLAASIAGLAADGRIWIAVIALLWIYFVVSNLILVHQRNQMADVVERDIVPFRHALERWVIPRRLTPAQTKSISEHLRSFRPSTVLLVQERLDEEAGGYRGDIGVALAEGGWSVTGVEQQDGLQPGLRLQMKQTQASAQRKDDPRDPRPDQILQKAFRQAGVPFDGSGSASGASITADELRIEIGPRRRDSHARQQAWPF